MQEQAGTPAYQKSNGDPWYTPERVRILLLNWSALAAMARSGDGDGSESDFYSEVKAVEGENSKGQGSSKRTKRPIPQGGFEDKSCIKADLHAALMSLDMGTRQVIVLSYVMGFTDVEIQQRTGLSNWKVRTAHHDGIERVARFLGWVRRVNPNAGKPVRRQYMRSALRTAAALEIAKAMNYCPAVGIPTTECVVCDAPYADDGQHMGPMRGH